MMNDVLHCEINSSSEEAEEEVDHIYATELLAVVNDLNPILNDDFGEDDEPDDAGGESEYPRRVAVDFPREASMILGTAGVEVSIRDLLSWLAANEPRHAMLITALRDEFYADDEEDYVEPQILPDTWGPFTPEQRAEARTAWSQHRDVRADQRMRIEAEIEAERAEEAAKWKPFASERAALDDASRSLDEREAELDAKWDRFVIERRAWGSDMAAHEAERRAELEAEADKLIADSNSAAERWSELRARAHEHFRNAE